MRQVLKRLPREWWWLPAIPVSGYIGYRFGRLFEAAFSYHDV